MKHLVFAAIITLSMLPALPAPAADLCREHLHTVHGGTKESVEQALQQELAGFRTLAERALTLRAETIKVGKAIKEKLDRGKPLSGDDIALINTGINAHLALRKELLAAAESHECWLDGSEKELARQGISPESRIRGVMLSLYIRGCVHPHSL